jgi:hypothetical protein
MIQDLILCSIVFALLYQTPDYETASGFKKPTDLIGFPFER